MIIMGIDPGPEKSAFAIYGNGNVIYTSSDELSKDYKRLHTVDNEYMVGSVGCIADSHHVSLVAIEMVACYGMPAGKSLFDTARWAGRFQQELISYHINTVLVYRKKIVTELCGSARAKDGNVRQALIDMLGEPGKKANPGPTYGIAKDTWQALAVAVYADLTIKD
jgi:Holliday junction resolvasome RuvABC endonuclease subunit